MQLPPGPWRTVEEALCALFPAIPASTWRDRIARGRVFVPDVVVTAATPARVGLEVHYYREVVDEQANPAQERLLHVDARLVVADKPHGLPVTPAGPHVAETLLARLVRRLDNPALVPLHRIDRDTAGLVLFSSDPATRARYQAMFRERAIDKEYQALAPPLPDLVFPHLRRSRIERGEPFFRMRETPGAANAETRIEVLERDAPMWRYALLPVTGRKHQLRLHMAALGAPIGNDPLYPQLRPHLDPAAPPLQLLARVLAFRDPLDGHARRFESTFTLDREGAGAG